MGDEVGCVREALPVPTVTRAWRHLRHSHNAASTGGALVPALWANIESFTWSGLPGASGLVPAPFPRIGAQLEAAGQSTPEAIISFTVQAIYQPPSGSATWGPPDAVREYENYCMYTGGCQTSWNVSTRPDYYALLSEAFQGSVIHSGIGAEVRFLVDGSPRVNPDSPSQTPSSLASRLTDGATGPQDHTHPTWVGFSDGMSVIVDLGTSRPIRGVGARFLQQPPTFFMNGDHTKPTPQNGSVFDNGTAGIYVPPSLSVWTSNATCAGAWHPLGEGWVNTTWWPQEVLDARTELLLLSAPPSVVGRFLWIKARSQVPPWAGHGLTAPGWIFVDELIVLGNDTVEVHV